MTSPEKYFKKYNTYNGPQNYLYWKGLIGKTQQDSNEKRCVILRPDAIGDYVLFTPFLAGLVDLFPDHKFSLIATDPVIELAKAAMLFDSFIEWDRLEYEKRDIYWKNFLKTAGGICADVLIYPCYSREANADEIVAVINAKEKIGIEGDYCNIPEKTAEYNKKFYTNTISIKSSHAHENERNRVFIESLGGRPKAPLPLWTEQDYLNVSRYFEKNEVQKPIIVIAPGASVSEKCWPIENFQETLYTILSRSSATAFIMGDKEDNEKAEWLITKTRFPERVRSITGIFNIRESAAFLSMASLFIGNDSGLAHIVCVLGIPGHIVTSGAHYGRFFPNNENPGIKVYTKKLPCFGCNWQCKRETIECIAKAEMDIERIIKDLTTL